MARKKKYTDEEDKYVLPPPQMPSEPPVLDVQCACCNRKSGLKAFVIIEKEKGWMPPHRFDTFCTKKCAKTWSEPADPKSLGVTVVEYSKWEDKKQEKGDDT